MKNPNKRDEEDELPVDAEAQEVADSLPGYQEYQKEARGDSLNFGDY
jgi:hypothetical protein